MTQQGERLKYRYTGDGYLFNLEPHDITVEEWDALPALVQSDVRAAPHVYVLVVDAPTAPDDAGPAKES